VSPKQKVAAAVPVAVAPEAEDNKVEKLPTRKRG